jgi:hypothetical protein
MNMTETAQLTPSDGLSGDKFGFSTSINAGGNAILVGAANATVNGNVQQGAAYVYVEPKGGWTTTPTFYAKLTASDGQGGDEFGWSANLIGNTGIIGTPFVDTRQGKAYVFVR